MTDLITVRTLTQGGQTAQDVAAELIAFLDAARRTLDIALYDVRLPGTVGDSVAGALRAAAARGVAVRIAFNDDGPRNLDERPLPPPVRTQPELLEALGVPLKAIPGEPDLMHHKFVVRDGEALWSGSTNWTLDSWTNEENLILTTASPALAAVYARVFAFLWERGHVHGSGDFDTEEIAVGDAHVRAWFSPGRGEALSHRIDAITGAQRRVRIASPVLTARPVLAALDAVGSAGAIDLAGVCDATQVRQVFRQWRANPVPSPKLGVLERILSAGHFTGKRSTPYAPDAVHDYMHAKVTVCDDTVFAGSFNLSRSGEMNAENVLEIRDAALAERFATFIDAIRARYPEAVAVPH